MALAFRDGHALEIAVRSGLAPAAGAARVGAGPGGELVVAPAVPLGRAALAALAAAGVLVDAELPPGAREVPCWAAAIAAVRLAGEPAPSLVLFVPAARRALLDLAAELVRLGCDRLELSLPSAAAPGGALRAVDAPTYTLVRALDREDGLRAYAPDPVGQDRVWTELGHAHPLASVVRPPDDALLLIAADGTWSMLPAGGWLPLDAALELAISAPPLHRASVAPPLERRRIELRLGGGRRDAPSLWVLREGGAAAVDRLLAYLPEEVVARLAFAATTGAAPVVVLRARTGRAAPPELALPDAEAYAPLPRLADVYAPPHALVEPPLRRERLRAVVGASDGVVTWLAPIDARAARGAFRVEQVDDAAFAPLADWADYVVHASVPRLAPWLRAVELDFAPYVVSAPAAPGAPEASHEPDSGPSARRTRTAAQPAAAPRARPRGAAPAHGHGTSAASASPTPAAAAPEPSSSAAPGAIAFDPEIAALEGQLVALDEPADAPARLALLARLGQAYARAGRRRDAGLCFARVVWEASPADAPARLDAWLAADLRGADADAAITELLARAAPTEDDIRAVAAIAARATLAVRRDPHRVQRWLDDHDAELDARAQWLARASLAALAGGDALALARTRDRILARLAGGLQVERELPSFLRFAGRSGALGAATGERLVEALDALARRLAKTKRKRLVLEPPPALTNAYVALLFAWGYARLAAAGRARAQLAAAHAVLEPLAADPVHRFLLAAYTARIEQALAGEPAETPLPPAIAAQLPAPSRTDRARYTVDQLREASWILEPLDRPDPRRAYLAAARPDAALAELRAIIDPDARAAALDARLAGAERPGLPAEDRARLVAAVLDALLELPERTAVPLLGRALAAVAGAAGAGQALLYAGALVVAAQFGRTDLVAAIQPPLLASLTTASRADLERALDKSLRALRRMGMRAELSQLLADAERALPATGPGAGDDALRGRLALAGGLAYLGEPDAAEPAFAAARAALATPLAIGPRLELVRALALAYAHAPLATALAGIDDLAATQWKDITDFFSTRSHFCLSVLHFTESLVLGVTSDDLALGEAGRRFVEDDEHLIRRRLHRDLHSVAP